jgi:hypothetical protein
MTEQKTRTIDLTPTWAGLMPALFACLQNGTPEGQELARAELMRLADSVDANNAARKAEPTTPAAALRDSLTRAYCAAAAAGVAESGVAGVAHHTGRRYGVAAVYADAFKLPFADALSHLRASYELTQKKAV